jgi:NDP-sugar pyrophosphorylase family protein
MNKMNSLLIMAGGVSSRMKNSLKDSSLDQSIKEQAQVVHKSLIPLGLSQHPLLYYLLKNAKAAGYKTIYLITSPENEAFKSKLKQWETDVLLHDLDIHFAIQYLPKNREKPLGTADAIQQTLEQHPALLKTTFSVCNGDNLYSTNVLERLRTERAQPHALISYARSGLLFSNDRISKFAVMNIDSEGYLIDIIEKPDPSIVAHYRDFENEIRVSMNIFSFNGALLYPFLKKCPIHPERNEKELPEALRQMNRATPKQTICLPVKEHLPDLTSAEDILRFEV